MKRVTVYGPNNETFQFFASASIPDSDLLWHADYIAGLDGRDWRMSDMTLVVEDC
jgi:hypothetical protein